MQTVVDIGEQRPPPRRWRRWAAVGLVAVTVGAALVVVRVLTAPEQLSLTEQLAAEVVSALEDASPDEHADHGHDFGADYGVLCTAEVFGFDPPSATSAAEVDTVYALHMCAVVIPGLGWPQAVRAFGPLAVELTDPAEVILPQQLDLGEDAVQADRVRALFPEEHHDVALEPRMDPALVEGLRDRLEAVQ